MALTTNLVNILFDSRTGSVRNFEPHRSPMMININMSVWTLECVISVHMGFF